jgi:signal transduction histidine kinase
MYNSLGDARSALRYAHETSHIARQSGDSTFLLRSYMALGDAYASSKKYDSLFLTSTQGLAMANRGNQLFPVGKFHLLLGDYYEHKENYDTAIASYTLALEAFIPIQVEYEICQAMYHLGHCYLLKKDHNKAIYYLKQAEEKIRALRLDQLLTPCLMDLVVADEQAGNIKESLAYLKEYVVVRDSLMQRNNRKLVYDLEARYQLQKKEEQIQLQQKLIRQKNQVNYLLGGTVISVLIILFFTFYTYRQRKRLQDQRIRDLEQEKLLSASEAIIKGQEEERGRLAKDLHDGLGGLLSGVKFSLTHMKSNVLLDADSALAFGRTLDMLDHSIAELRRVAHNMMPEVLVKFGLGEALKSYCDSMQQSGIFKVDFQEVGMAQRLDANREIIVYRIVQELLNNAAKHSRATHVLVQLAGHAGEVNITVEDNGAGFNVGDLSTSYGAGWSSIRSRVDYLKGKVDVHSEAGKGTSVQLILPV